MADSTEDLEISPTDVKEMLDQGVEFKFLDVRTSHERRLACLAETTHMTEELVQDIMDSWPKDTKIVLHCHLGIRSLDAAMYLHSQGGFTDVKSMSGGITAWSAVVDDSIPTY